MRFLLAAAVAVIALVSSPTAAVAETSNGVNLVNDNNQVFARSLRSHTDREERSIAEILEEDEDEEDRAVWTVNYRTWYMAKLTPTQVKTVLGVSQTEMNNVAKQLQRLYLGYYSFYTEMERKKEEKKRLATP
ncbi:hypothetical protein JG687_00010565 [Phytophthora cactorum]|uniref:RxLR effector protein n=1 Tax=Phytophthora cactorum TaxID=29920 RepID=A0A329RNQ5_9STRA|nr:hypothetical protein Pcac1_g17714 [Phytophthora cactorum]KAG2826973.1 hypothetical protein PC112_g9050 [Phytophthora cactorum]KAG2828957.1 hypothetical protein PC111_g7951 [Phytophthora cactorum]KAG2858890.1 hypothetical protein PC113_g9430 [Phytophthora cactorum]KAG2908013.1 hypothetical protein PC114_g10635 [Phytophthora cactorum]